MRKPTTTTTTIIQSRILDDGSLRLPFAIIANGFIAAIIANSLLLFTETMSQQLNPALIPPVLPFPNDIPPNVPVPTENGPNRPNPDEPIFKPPIKEPFPPQFPVDYYPIPRSEGLQQCNSDNQTLCPAGTTCQKTVEWDLTMYCLDIPVPVPVCNPSCSPGYECKLLEELNNKAVCRPGPCPCQDFESLALEEPGATFNLYHSIADKIQVQLDRNIGYFGCTVGFRIHCSTQTPTAEVEVVHTDGTSSMFVYHPTVVVMSVSKSLLNIRCNPDTREWVYTSNYQNLTGYLDKSIKSIVCRVNEARKN